MKKYNWVTLFLIEILMFCCFPLVIKASYEFNGIMESDIEAKNARAIVSANGMEAARNFKVKYTIYCDKGEVDTFGNKWQFLIFKRHETKYTVRGKEYKLSEGEYYSFGLNTQIIAQKGVYSDHYVALFPDPQKNEMYPKLANLSKNSHFVNLSTDSKYSTANIIKNKSCPKYIYMASSNKKQQIAYIFSDTEISGVEKNFNKKGYNMLSTYEDPGEDINAMNIENFEKQVQKMKDNINVYKTRHWDKIEDYDELVECKKKSYFGGIKDVNGDNIQINEFFELRNRISINYDFTEANKVLEEYKNSKCNYVSGDIDDGTDMDSCAVIPDEIKKWIVNILKIVRYLALALVIVLGSLDFMKAAGSGEPDQMKKAGQAFIKRLIAVIVLFLLPYIVELLLGLIELLGADPNCVDIGSY